MRVLMRCRFGSHLHGTSTPQSDEDFKSVVVPDAKDILLQRASSVQGVSGRKKEFGEKSFPGGIDEERISLHAFMRYASAGDIMALDMLFAPPEAMTQEPSREWRAIVANRVWFLTKQSQSFVVYAQKRAAKYGLRGSRIAAARLALSLINEFMAKPNQKLGVASVEIITLCGSTEHMDTVRYQPEGRPVEMMWEVCNLKMPFNASVQNAHDMMTRLIAEYGKRALLAESNEGVDWKAVSHAVRVGHEALELLTTGKITFPLPNAAHILAIKQGRIPYRDAATEIEGLLEKVEAAAVTSSLRDEPDMKWVEGFVADVYAAEVVDYVNSTTIRSYR